jgi:Bacterial archaeo-eukaryotic release factor family 3
MNSLTLSNINKVVETGSYEPAISIIMPFDPKMSPKSEIVYQLKYALEKVQESVMANYKNDLGILVMQKLRNLVSHLNFSTYKKSIAIYLSPVFEKVLYLDIPVEMCIRVNDQFDVRDLISAKKQSNQFLVLVLDEYCSNIYLGKDLKISKLKSNIIRGGNRTTARHRANVESDVVSTSDERLKKILHCSDDGLNALLQSYQYPVLAVGSAKALAYFQANTSHKNRIIAYAASNSSHVSEAEMYDLIMPHVADWQNLRMKNLLQKLAGALEAKSIASGIGNVRRMAAQNMGSLLMVEKNYRVGSQLLESTEGLYTSKGSYHKYSPISDVVGEIIEIVLENGGDVEFVENGFLNDFEQIVLIKADNVQVL